VQPKFISILALVALCSAVPTAAQSKPNFSRDYVYGPGGQLVMTAEPDTYPPPVINTLSGSFNQSQCLVTLSWTAPVDIGSGVSFYKIYRNSTYYDQTTSTSYQDSGIQGSKTYTYTVTSIDVAGNMSAQSNVYRISTPQTCSLVIIGEQRFRLREPQVLAASFTPDRPFLRYLRWLVQTGQLRLYDPIPDKAVRSGGGR
jgi:hypothetical protein